MLPTTNNRSVILIFLLIISVGLTIPLLAVLVVGYPSHQATPQGVPVINTAFSNLVNSEPDAVMLPAFPIVETETSITMRSDYDTLVQLNESSAVFAALNFISKIWYLSDTNVSYDNSGGLDEGSWHLRFFGDNLTIIIDVNAISGKVDYFSSSWPTEHSPFLPSQDESRFANTTELEELVFDFLYQLNYTLSPFARYIGPTLVYDYILHHEVYAISFYNFVNRALIEYNGVHLIADIEANAILRFSYRWINIDAIPMENIISPERAEQSAREYLEGPMNLKEYEIQATVLVFERVGTHPSHEYRLGWVVIVKSEFVTSIHIDAKGDYHYNMGFYSASSFQSPSAPFSQNALRISPIQCGIIFVVSIAIALVASSMVRRRMISHLSG